METASKLVPALPTLHTSIPHFVENQINKDLLKSPRLLSEYTLACPLSIVQAMGAVIRPISIVRHHGAKFGEIKLENWLSLHCKLSKLLLVLLRN